MCLGHQRSRATTSTWHQTSTNSDDRDGGGETGERTIFTFECGCHSVPGWNCKKSAWWECHVYPTLLRGTRKCFSSLTAEWEMCCTLWHHNGTKNEWSVSDNRVQALHRCVKSFTLVYNIKQARMLLGRFAQSVWYLEGLWDIYANTTVGEDGSVLPN